MIEEQYVMLIKFTCSKMKGSAMQSTYNLMKLVLLLMLSMLVTLSLFGCGNEGAQGGGEAQQRVFQVDELLADPRNFQDETVATGTITTFSGEGAAMLMGVVDNQHILECRNLDCIGSKIYAVNMSGQALPEPGDVITMVGAFEDTGGFWIFHISDYQVNNNIIDLLQ
jgi:hypothetical protein